jgi:GMP synthase-like glutamine amidotransferase
VRLHYLQHEPFEDPGNILAWAEERRCRIDRTMLYKGEALPAPDSFEFLVVMGGSMGVYDEQRYPWLVAERDCIAAAVDGGKKVLGICLGAQLISVVLGGRVRRNEHEEIGWFPVRLTSAGAACGLFRAFPPEFEAFHWHADTFSIPSPARRLAQSDACRNQAFTWAEGRVAALQFHIEVDPSSLVKMARYLARQGMSGPFVQEPAEVARAAAERCARLKPLLYGMLNAMAALP